MPKRNVRAKARGVALSGQENPKQYRLKYPRLASCDRSSGVASGRTRTRKRRRSSSTSTCPSPSQSIFRPITDATEFTEEHMDALHMVPVLNCPLEEVVPLDYCPEDLLHRIRPFWTVSREDLYYFNCERQDAAIDEAAGDRCRPQDMDITRGIYLCTDAITQLMGFLIADDIYLSDSDEVTNNWSKRTTFGCAVILLRTFLNCFTQLRTQKLPSWDRCNLIWNTRVLPEGYNFTVQPDNVIFYAPGKRQRTPFAWITINPGYLAPTTDSYESVLPQIAAQTIAMTRYQPREVFGLEFSRLYVTIWRALIPENYLELLKDSGDLPPDVFIEMKRSTVLDLEQPEGRREFSRALLALLMYWNEKVSDNK
ncbi:hypothetical protein IWQ61_009809 [Dispira simplex]|nr:hypothetical protein IWQ61_009809 [Dispira simplex]